MAGPCAPYITEEQVKALPGVCAVPADAESPDYAAIAAAASQVVYVLTGRQFPGPCRATVRPVRRSGDCFPASLLGVWLGQRADYCEGDVLPLHDPMYVVAPTDDDDGHPVVVKINGSEFTDFYVRDNRSIVRSDGRPWPSGNKLHLADTETGTWSVTYSFGIPAPKLVVDAAAELAAEYLKADLTDPNLKLPPGTTSWSRGGFSGSVRDEAEAVRSAGSALPAVAKAMGAYNPNNTRLPALISDFDREWDLVVV